MANIPEADLSKAYWGYDDYSIELLSNARLVLRGGGSFYNDGVTAVDERPSAEARNAAEELARKYGKRITSEEGDWWGYSEYTPDPGDVSIFDWVDV